ncbi:ATP-dependent DNA ligase LigD phosphoesterase module /ATP-dependent DNA ligase LigD polymerase module [Humitalea rosea]|uniref:DNA ligase (ATP) n=1 Tax=Humitalea rosea TaxID=990373 RepID=A0A2W7I1N3_9PROT|nr:DNA ligase D [Humitalea rosea]PZW40069.1 ATP-dependent DNA ligase LigD phosphoesterase module /ATP-dependent DNA ligase LigD polymerase module [Humitalea rosea]
MATPADSLAPYNAKRDFSRTSEPRGKTGKPGKRLSFVVQRHDATRLHYDFRLEWGGVLKSWAVTRGPSLDPADKRLAVEVEDHPLEYGSFEGTIPKPAYGGGTVQLWDRGVWAPLDPDTVDADLAKGELKFVLSGERLKGGFVLVRMKPRRGEKPGRHNWLLIKERDSMATPGEGDAVLRAETSVASGRTLAEIAGKAAPAKTSPAKSPPTKSSKTGTATRPPAAEPMPDFVPPQLCLLVATPPREKPWLHELKLDGYRIQLRVQGGKPALRTRAGLDWTARFPAIAKAAASLPDCLIDGEAVALDEDGQPSFPALQATLSGERKAPLAYYAFDLLHDGRRDLRGETLLTRKQALRALLLPESGPILRYLDHFTAPGEAVLASACRLEMEGIVSKRGDAPYASGRGDAWTKSKCRGRDEFIVGGWSRDKAGRGLGALLLGAWREGSLAYLGRAGTGFSHRSGADMLKRLEPLARKTSPFAGRQPARTSGVTWAEPRIVVEIAYGGWTEEGVLRHASFQGLREDKPVAEVTPPPKPAAPLRPAARDSNAPRLTHPDKILWPATETTRAVTKQDLADHYARFAERILAHIAGRPLSVLRAPDGIEGQVFFQRHAMRGQSPLIGAVEIAGQPKPYMRIDDAAGLAALAQVAVLELHPWGAMADRPEVPDRLIFDLDPAPGLDFAAVVAGALELRQRLEALGLTPFPRVTGGKGLHLVVPLDVTGEAPDWDTAKAFARLVCVMMARDAPDRYTTTLAKKARTGRIFLDYLRNDRLSTAIANWSPRARPGAPVARPIGWNQVTPKLDPSGWRLPDLLAGALPREPWPGFGAAAGSLREAIARATR